MERQEVKRRQKNKFFKLFPQPPQNVSKCYINIIYRNIIQDCIKNGCFIVKQSYHNIIILYVSLTMSNFFSQSRIVWQLDETVFSFLIKTGRLLSPKVWVLLIKESRMSVTDSKTSNSLGISQSLLLV